MPWRWAKAAETAVPMLLERNSTSVVLRPIYGGQLGLGLGVQGVKCLAQGGGAAAQAVLVVGVLQQKGVVVPGAGR